MEILLVDNHWRGLIERGISKDTFRSPFDAERYMDDLSKRDDFRHSISWHIPTDSLINLLKELSPILSVGSGFAYTESIALEKGVDIIATDIQPDSKNLWCRGGEFFMQVEKLSSKDAVELYHDRNVFMAWPPYNNPMAFQTAKAMQTGRFLVYVGESYGGCTGDDTFFEYLHSNFEEVEKNAIVPSWSGIYDNVYVYKKI